MWFTKKYVVAYEVLNVATIFSEGLFLVLTFFRENGRHYEKCMPTLLLLGPVCNRLRSALPQI